MVRATKTPPKSSAVKSKKNGCTLTVKPKVLLNNLTLLIALQLNLVPEEGKDVACNNILVEDDDALYCLTQLVSE